MKREQLAWPGGPGADFEEGVTLGIRLMDRRGVNQVKQERESDALSTVRSYLPVHVGENACVFPVCQRLSDPLAYPVITPSCQLRLGRRGREGFPFYPEGRGGNKGKRHSSQVSIHKPCFSCGRAGGGPMRGHSKQTGKINLIPGIPGTYLEN